MCWRAGAILSMLEQACFILDPRVVPPGALEKRGDTLGSQRWRESCWHLGGVKRRGGDKQGSMGHRLLSLILPESKRSAHICSSQGFLLPLPHIAAVCIRNHNEPRCTSLFPKRISWSQLTSVFCGYPAPRDSTNTGFCEEVPGGVELELRLGSGSVGNTRCLAGAMLLAPS